MSASLDDLLTTTPVDGGFEGRVPDGWQQGRSTFGGLVVGMIVRTLERRFGRPGQAVRSVSAELFGQVVPGALHLDVAVLREGSQVTTAQAWVRQGDEVVAHGVVVLGAPRPAMPTITPAWDPATADWRSVAPLEMSGPPFPTFTQHFEYRNAGPWPFAGGARGVLEGWVRPRTPATVHDAAWLAALVDTYWPPTAVTFEGPRPVATVGYHLDVVADPASVVGDDPLLQRGVSVAGREGYVSEDRDLWSADGRLLARNRQMLVIIK